MWLGNCSFSNAEIRVLKKVLIVDDSMAEMKLMQNVLEQAGYWPVPLNDPTRIEQTIDAEHPGPDFAGRGNAAA